MVPVKVWCSCKYIIIYQVKDIKLEEMNDPQTRNGLILEWERHKLTFQLRPRNSGYTKTQSEEPSKGKWINTGFIADLKGVI